MVQVIGHRGCAKLEPENTLRGFRKAMKLDVDYIELDVHQCLSGELVVIHDDKLERTTDGKGKVYDHVLHELKKLNAGKKEKIPTLNQVLFILDNKLKIIIELKGAYVEKKVVDLVEKHKLVHNVILSSFVHSRLARVRKLNPNIKIAYTVNRLAAKKVKNLRHASQIHIRYSFVSKKLVEEAHKRGIEVFAWTVNAKRAIKKLVTMGIDGIITDNPEIMKKL